MIVLMMIILRELLWGASHYLKYRKREIIYLCTWKFYKMGDLHIENKKISELTIIGQLLLNKAGDFYVFIRLAILFMLPQESYHSQGISLLS